MSGVWTSECWRQKWGERGRERRGSPSVFGSQHESQTWLVTHGLGPEALERNGQAGLRREVRPTAIAGTAIT